MVLSFMDENKKPGQGFGAHPPPQGLRGEREVLESEASLGYSKIISNHT